MTAKTDWKITDRFNVADYERMTSNINLACGAAGIMPPVWPSLSVGRIQGLPTICRQLIDAYTALLPFAPEWPRITYQNRWLLWSECSQIESLCVAVFEKYSEPPAHTDLKAYTYAELKNFKHKEIEKGAIYHG